MVPRDERGEDRGRLAPLLGERPRHLPQPGVEHTGRPLVRAEPQRRLRGRGLTFWQRYPAPERAVPQLLAPPPPERRKHARREQRRRGKLVGNQRDGLLTGLWLPAMAGRAGCRVGHRAAPAVFHAQS